MRRIITLLESSKNEIRRNEMRVGRVQARSDRPKAKNPGIVRF